MNINNLQRRRAAEVKHSKSRLFIGNIFWIFGIGLLIWNEMEAVRINGIVTSMIEGIHIIKNPNSYDEKKNNSMVYIHGMIRVEEPLTVPEYGLSVPAVVLKQRVQMYQWVENVEEVSDETGGTSQYEYYQYSNEWRDKIIDSQHFFRREGHENPVEFPIKSHVYLSPTVKIGSYALRAELKLKFKDFVLITSDERPERHDIKMHAGLYYHTSDVWNPKVGDIRIQFSYSGYSGEAVSIIATQFGKELGGSDLLILEKGKVLPSEIITNKHNWNMWLVRFYRACGWLSLYIGSTIAKSLLYCFGQKNWKLYKFLSLDRRISLFTSLATVVMAVIVSSIWTIYKPLIGGALAILFLSPFVWCASSSESKDIKEYKMI